MTEIVETAAPEITTPAVTIPVPVKRKVAKQVEELKETLTEKDIKIKKQREKDLKLVKGRFEFTEITGKGAPLKFTYGGIYKDIPPKEYKMIDGEVYEIPFMVAKHLNETGQYTISEHAVDADGKRHERIGQKVRRYGFFPLGFDEDYGQHTSKILTVERV